LRQFYFFASQLSKLEYLRKKIDAVQADTNKGKAIVTESTFSYRSSMFDSDEVNPWFASGRATVICQERSSTCFTYTKIFGYDLYIDWAQLYRYVAKIHTGTRGAAWPIDKSESFDEKLVLSWNYRRPFWQTHKSRLTFRFESKQTAREIAILIQKHE
jgi:hypothetical protein